VSFPMSDASRRPFHLPVVTASIIVVNLVAFGLELAGGEAFVTRWSLVPADIVAGRHWITVLTAMFLHGSVSHLVGNMVFLWAFGPEVEDLMQPRRYLVFYLLGGLAATAAQLVAGPDSTVPNLGASGAIAAVMGAFLVTYPHDRIRSLLIIFVFVRVTYIPAAIPHWGLVPHSAREPRRGGPRAAAGRRCGVRRARRGLHLRGRRRAALHGSAATGAGERGRLTQDSKLKRPFGRR